MFIVWKDEYSIGENELDGHHKKMFEIINVLYELSVGRASREETDRIIQDVSAYAQYHFSAEEETLEKVGYPQLDRQASAHRAFSRRLDEHRRLLFASPGALSQEMLQFLKEWWLNHILRMDRDYASYVKELPSG
jgi:hemerythrin